MRRVLRSMYGTVSQPGSERECPSGPCRIWFTPNERPSPWYHLLDLTRPSRTFGLEIISRAPVHGSSHELFGMIASARASASSWPGHGPGHGCRIQPILRHTTQQARAIIIRCNLLQPWAPGHLGYKSSWDRIWSGNISELYVVTVAMVGLRLIWNVEGPWPQPGATHELLSEICGANQETIVCMV